MARKDRKTRRLFPKGGQFEFFEKSYAQELAEQKAGGVECLGMHFPDDDARRAHFMALLAEKLKDPEFRKTEGFPLGADEAILRLSDPPYYTACPNPFLEEFVRVYGKPYDPKQPYHREPFAVDTSVGKTDQIYKAHSYHTKVPHLAIVPSILHYTMPGDIVFDGFCGTGMTGVAAQWCGAAPKAFRDEVEAQWKGAGRSKPDWGPRRVVLNDLSPAATFIAAGYNLPFDAEVFLAEGRRILDEVDAELGWMYETLHSDGRSKGRIEYTVWSEVFACPECSGEVVFVNEALDLKTKRVREHFPCPGCSASLHKESLVRSFEALIDPATGQPWKRIRLRPVLLVYALGSHRHEKVPDDEDLKRIKKIERLPFPPVVPTRPFPLKEMYHGSRLGPKGVSSLHHMFLPRVWQALGALWHKAGQVADTRQRNALHFLIEQALWSSSIANSYRPSGYSHVSQYMKGIYYIPSQHAELSPWYVLDGKLSRLAKAFASFRGRSPSIVSTQSCESIGIPSNTADYIFTDPPFGSNIPYADLNLMIESWLGVCTDTAPEAIVDGHKGKALGEYQVLVRKCFAECHRVLKPGRWITVVFSNSSNAVWRPIQEAMGAVGFVVADVRTLDKQSGSYRQVTSSAVKQDLVISAYKPTDDLALKFTLGDASEAGVWAFIAEHLGNIPVFVGREDEAEVLSERTAQVLMDRMIGFHVQRGLGVPMDAPEFYAGLEQRFPKRDGMYFLPHQAAEYDRRRGSVKVLRQLVLAITDEASALQWVRQQLNLKPRTFQDLQPQFTKEIKVWASYEATVELRDILESNFLCYDGKGPVPSQIHSYLKDNFKDLRGLAKDDKPLVEKARDRWYVPDPGKEGDLVRLREKALLEEFARYQGSKGRLKQFRTEAIRAGFKAAYDARNYKAIVEVAARIPESVLQEDEKLLMYFDVASTRLGE